MKLKIISDGTSYGTRLVNADTNEPIGFVESIEWKVSVGDPAAKAIITFVNLPVEILCEVDLENETD